MDGVIAFITAIAIACCVTNCAADQKTFRDCAINGQAKMMSGGSIQCSVIKGES